MSIASKTIIIAAVSSRIYAEAAVNAGLDVIAIDAFSDTDLQAIARRCYQVNSIDNQLDGDEVLDIIRQLDLQPVLGFCYGAGFEKNPQILQAISQYLPLLGNAPDIVRQCKQPVDFFGLCDELDIPHPEVCYQRPINDAGWLQKHIGGSGGNHVIALEMAQDINLDSVYYQKRQSGKAVSCLFIVSDCSVDVIGFNLLWSDEADCVSYRYGGAMSGADINEHAKINFTNYVEQLAKALALSGLNSCDAICDGDDIYILEINPRLSASIDLYPERKVMHKHIAAFVQTEQRALQPKLVESDSASSRTNVAHQIIYARHPVAVKNDITWPSWVHDVPYAGQQFDSGMPICTVKIEADTIDQVQLRLVERVAWVESQLLN